MSSKRANLEVTAKNKRKHKSLAHGNKGQFTCWQLGLWSGFGPYDNNGRKKKNPKQTWITMSPNKLLKYDKFDYLMTYFLWTVVKISAWLKLN